MADRSSWRFRHGCSLRKTRHLALFTPRLTSGPLRAVLFPILIGDGAPNDLFIEVITAFYLGAPDHDLVDQSILMGAAWTLGADVKLVDYEQS